MVDPLLGAGLLLGGASIFGSRSAERASRRASQEQALAAQRGQDLLERAGQEAQGFFDPFQGIIDRVTGTPTATTTTTGQAVSGGMTREEFERELANLPPIAIKMGLDQELRRQFEQNLVPGATLTQEGPREGGLANFLGDPQAQFDFLQNNPLFQFGLENLNRNTLQRAAAGGRLGAGDTSSELFQNALLASSPLIDRQREDIGNLLNIATGTTSARANARLGTASQQIPLITGSGNALAAGIIGQSNARQQGLQNLAGLFGQYMGIGGQGIL